MVNCDFFGLTIDVQSKVLVEPAKKPEGTIIRAHKWRFMAVMPHIHVGSHMQINSMMAMPSRKNKLEVLH